MDTQTMAILMLVINVVLGVVFCFFGNRWLKVILAIYGFAAGFYLANTLLPLFTSLNGTNLLLASLGVGVVGALLFVFALYLGIFFIGFGGGVLLCQLIADALALNILSWYIYVPALIICCLLGAVTLHQKKIFIAVFTSFIGASALAQFVDQVVNGIRTHSFALYDLQGTTDTVLSSTVYLVSLAVLFVAGLIVQLAVTSKNKP